MPNSVLFETTACCPPIEFSMFVSAFFYFRNYSGLPRSFSAGFVNTFAFLKAFRRNRHSLAFGIRLFIRAFSFIRRFYGGVWAYLDRLLLAIRREVLFEILVTLFNSIYRLFGGFFLFGVLFLRPFGKVFVFVFLRKLHPVHLLCAYRARLPLLRFRSVFGILLRFRSGIFRIKSIDSVSVLWYICFGRRNIAFRISFVNTIGQLPSVCHLRNWFFFYF